jgi:histidinol-phosphate aminotransferase
MFSLDKIIRPNIMAMKPYSSARDEFKKNTQKMVFLDANENPYENGVNRYPDTQQKDVKSILTGLKGISTSQILIGNGSDEVLDLIFRAFCNPVKDNVITLPPTYGMYEVLANLNAVQIREVLLTEDFQPSIDEIMSKIDENTKLIFICSPNNPSGNSFDNAKIQFLLENFNGLVVIDEAYIDFSSQNSWLEKLEQYPNLIITQTLSKAFGLAGIRMGILYASSDIVAVLNKIKPPYNINTLSQLKAIEVLNDQGEINRKIYRLKENREVLLKELLQIKFIQKIYPTDSNFVLIKVDDANKRYDQLVEKGIVVRNRTTQPLCENCIRISVGTEEENKTVIKALKTLE